MPEQPRPGLIPPHGGYRTLMSYQMAEKDDPRAKKIRSLAYIVNRSYTTYKTYVEDEPPEIAANALICIVHQTNYLLDKQLRSLEQAFLENGGFTERLYHARRERRDCGYSGRG